MYIRLRGVQKVVLLILMLFMISLMTVNNVEAGKDFAGGSGTEKDPYLVETAEHLDNVRHYLGKQFGPRFHFKQVADIDLSNIWYYHNFSPIGTWDPFEPFWGIYDGNGYSIKNLCIDYRTDGVQGLFGCSHGEIKNVVLENARVRGEDRVGGLVGFNRGLIKNCRAESHIGDSTWTKFAVGGLVGRNSLYGIIEDSYATGKVEGHWGSMGGLVGQNDGAIRNSASSSTLVHVGRGDTNRIGGLVGRNNDRGVIENSKATGKLSGPDGKLWQGGGIGGLAGINYGLIRDSYANLDIRITSRDAGGLVGYNRGNIENSKATGQVEAYQSVGGLTGYNGSGTIKNSAATGNVTGSFDRVGGLIGLNDGGAVSGSYAEGNVNLTTDRRFIGGLVGDNRGNISESYAKGNVSAPQNSNHAGGLVGINKGDISDSFAWGTVDAGRSTGGLVGTNENTILRTYAVGLVISGDGNVGGLVGYNHDTVKNSYYDKDTSNRNDPGRGEARTTEEMETGFPSNHIYRDWDTGIWHFYGDRYPVLQWLLERDVIDFPDSPDYAPSPPSPPTPDPEPSPPPSPSPSPVLPDPDPPVKANILSPTGRTQVEGTKIYFSWEKVNGANKYDLQVKQVTDNAIFKEINGLSSVSTSLSGFPDDGTEFKWRVRAENEGGSGPWSDYSEFINGIIPATTYGDVIGSGTINVNDVVLTMRFVLALESLSGEEIKRSDVNGDGKVDILDVTLIMRKALGLIDEFPVSKAR